jgi:FKBP-type peptidyl-prolyl cis-trans isomerase
VKQGLTTIAVLIGLTLGLTASAQDVRKPDAPDVQGGAAPNGAQVAGPEVPPADLAYAFGVMSAKRFGERLTQMQLKKTLVAKGIADVKAGGDLAIDQQSMQSAMMGIMGAFRGGRPVAEADPAGEDPEPKEIKTALDKASYAGGVFVARQVSAGASEAKMDLDSLFAGLIDQMSGKPLRLDEKQLADASSKMRAAFRGGRGDRRERGRQALEDGKKFLEANAQNEGVKTLDNGLQYKVVKEGSGPIPKATDTVRAHYRSMKTDGTEFESSYNGEPIEVPLNKVIPGWSEALQRMKVGSKWTVYLPPALAYGDRSVGQSSRRGGGGFGGGGGLDIPPNSTLIFELELLEIVQHG